MQYLEPTTSDCTVGVVIVSPLTEHDPELHVAVTSTQLSLSMQYRVNEVEKRSVD
jgi:hypothetical protein